MSGQGTTSINELPYAPTQLQPQPQLQPQLQPQIQPQIQPNMQLNDSSVLSLDPNTISQIVSGIQQASISGATLLPSRDIPQNTIDIHQDPNVQVDYVPDNRNKEQIIDSQKQMDDYLKDIDYENKKQINSSDKLDQLYNELHRPFLLIILYFLFQLPIIRKILFKNMSFLFLKDGNPNIYYLLFTSFLFGFSYYLLEGILERLKTLC